MSRSTHTTLYAEAAQMCHRVAPAGEISEIAVAGLESRARVSPFFRLMVDRLSRRGICLLALLLGVLVGSARSVAAQPSAPSQDIAAQHEALSVLGDEHGARCPVHIADWAPLGHQSPSWHRGTGRRTSRSAGCSAIAAPAGSIPAADPFIRQRVASFVRSTARLQSTGRSAASPRAPPAIS